MPELPGTAWFETRPDWVGEVISSSTAKYDRGIKREIYARERVAHYWIVDPIERIIEVFELRGAGWALIRTAIDDQTVGLEPFAAMPFGLEVLWC